MAVAGEARRGAVPAGDNGPHGRHAGNAPPPAARAIDGRRTDERTDRELDYEVEICFSWFKHHFHYSEPCVAYGKTVKSATSAKKAELNI